VGSSGIILDMQQGTLRKNHGGWYLRYYQNEIGPDGQPRRRQIEKLLARVDDDHRSPKDLDDLIAKELAKVTHGGTAQGSLTLAQFADTYWLPTIAAKRRASTHKFYRDLFDNHLRDRVGDVRLRDFQTVNAQRVLDDIDLSHASLQRIKTGMSALFSHALRLGFISGHNPVHEAQPEGRRSEFEGAAYTAADVEHMLGKLTGLPRVVVGVAAFTGLRLAELRGLQWADYDGRNLYVRRSVWRKNIGQTKTPDSKSSVPVIRPLRVLLDAHKASSNGSLWIFQGAKNGFALNLDNLTGREIRPVFGDRWRGWHAFRRGIATVLFGLGVDAEVASMILRHSDSAVTRRHYIKLQSQKEGAAAMQRLEKSLAGKGQLRGNKTRPKPQGAPKPHKH
jgi:integrase